MSIGLLAILVVLGSCGDRRELWTRYQAQKSFFKAQQAISRAELSMESGQPVNREDLGSRLEDALMKFNRLESEFTEADSTLLTMASQAYLGLARLHEEADDGLRALEVYGTLFDDARLPHHFRNIALMRMGRGYERQNQHLEAVSVYRRLMASFYPPESRSGVNREVLGLGRRIVNIGSRLYPDSLSSWREQSELYYDSLAINHPYTVLSIAALGELASIRRGFGEWDLVLATLERATDSAGVIAPAFRVDMAEILAGRLFDTSAALLIYDEVEGAYPESVFRIDAELKRVQILMRRREYGEVRDRLEVLKEEFEDRPGVVIPAQFAYARSFEAEGDFARARAEYQYLASHHPRSLQAVDGALVIARRAHVDGQSSMATQWYDKADQMSADLAGSGNVSEAVAGRSMEIRAIIAIERERWDEAALRLGEITRAFDPRSPLAANALIRLGWLHLSRRADTLAAADAWTRFIKAFPGDPQTDSLRIKMSTWPKIYTQDLPT